MSVKAVGPLDAKIMLVGEAPGKEEEIAGIPFVGAAGKLLNQFLSQVMISRSDCFITNVIDERPINNDFGTLYEDKGRKIPSQFLLDGYGRLKAEIEKVKPNVIVALGNEALRAITGLTGITKYRGSILSSILTDVPYKVVPIIHPASTLRMWDSAPLTVMDLTRVREQSQSPHIDIKHRSHLLISHISQLEHEVNEALYHEYLSFDIETCNNQISCIGFAPDPYYAFVVPIHMFDTSFWSEIDEKIVWTLIRKLLESNVKKIAQKADFDMYFLKSTLGISVNNLWMDTMCAFHCVYPELRKGLDMLCSIYTDQPYYKDMIKADYYRYNALDCMITYECAMKIKEELKEFRTWGFYKNVVHPMIGIILKMELRGVRVDIEKKDLATIAFEEDIKALQEKLNKAIGHELNVNAPKQVAEFLYTELGLPEQYNRKTGRITTDEKAIQRLTIKYPSIVFDYLLKLKEKKKIHSTYLTAELDEDGRIRCSYILSGTKSGRLASRMSRLGSGMNLQNVPKGICREILIPDEGCMFISADLSQAEARVVGYLAGEGQLIRIFESGGDVHTLVAAIIFNKKEGDVTKWERELAKHIVHACNYGMGASTFGDVTGLGFVEAKEKLNLYHINFPRVRMWQMEIEAKLRKTRTLETPLGRRRTFFGRWNSELVRDAYSYIPQSTVADAVLMGMIELDRRLPKECEILLNIHDEVVIQVPVKGRSSITVEHLISSSALEEHTPITIYETAKWHTSQQEIDEEWFDTLKGLIVECMTVPIKIGERVLKIPVNTKHGYNWNEVS